MYFKNDVNETYNYHNIDINIDSTWFFLKSDFLQKLQDKSDKEQHRLFWNSKMKCIVCNEQPFIAIDEQLDFDKLEYLREMILVR